MRYLFASMLVIVVSFADGLAVEPDLDLCRQDAKLQRPALLNAAKEDLRDAGVVLRRVKAAAINPQLDNWVSDDGRQVLFKTKQDKADTIGIYSNRIVQLKGEAKGMLPSIPYIRFPLTVGQVGRLEFENILKLVQLVDEGNILVETWFTKRDDPGPDAHAVKKLVWLSGLSTAGLTDDDERVEVDNRLFLPRRKIPWHAVFQVTGTKQYETLLGGSKTVLLLEPLDDETVDKLRASLTKK